MIVTRPSAVVTPATPASEPFDDPFRGIAAANEVEPAPLDIVDRRGIRSYPLDEARAPKRRQGTPSMEHQDGGDGRGRGVHLAAAMILESHRMDGGGGSSPAGEGPDSAW